MKAAVLIATYNGQKYLPALLDSLKRQTFRDLVLYAHDDGSKDCTPEILKEYAEDSGLDLRILDFPPTGSACANFLTMLRHIGDEDYILFCDQDDVWLEDKVEKSIAKIREIEEPRKPALVFSDLRVVDSDLNTISDSFMAYSGLDPENRRLEQLLIDNVAAGCTMLFNRELAHMAAGYKDLSNIKIHDHFLLLAAVSAGKTAFIHEPLILYRQHGGNQIGAVENRSRLSKLLSLSGSILSGKYRRDLHEWISRLARQAGEAARLEGIPEKEKALLLEFAGIEERSRKERVRFYKENGITRKKNTSWFLLWC